MAESAPSKDTQEEKPRLNQTDLPSCLNLTVPRRKSIEDPKTGVWLSCTKVTKDKGPEEQPNCPRYECHFEKLLDCSTISYTHTCHPVQCPEEGQEMQQEMQQGHKCWAKSTEDPRNIHFCCPPEVLQDVTLEMEKLPAPKKQQLSAMDPQEANLDHQTPKTPRDHQTSPRKTRSSRERRDSGNPTPMLDHPTPTHIPLCLDTSLDHQHPGLGQESSQGFKIAMGVLGALGFLVPLGFLVMRWWKGWRGWRGQKGRREKRRSSEDALRAEEGLEEEEEDGDGM